MSVFHAGSIMGQQPMRMEANVAHLSLKNHRKLRRLMQSLSISRPTAMGHLECLWHDVQEDKNVGPDGGLQGWTMIDIANAADWMEDVDLFVNCLVTAGFLDKEKSVFKVHDYGAFAPEFVRKRWKRSGKATVGHEFQPEIDDLSRQCPDNGGQRPPLSSTKRSAAQLSAAQQEKITPTALSPAEPTTARSPPWISVVEVWNEAANRCGLPKVRMPIAEKYIRKLRSLVKDTDFMAIYPAAIAKCEASNKAGKLGVEFTFGFESFLRHWFEALEGKYDVPVRGSQKTDTSWVAKEGLP